MTPSIGRNEGFILREEFVCKAIVAAPNSTPFRSASDQVDNGHCPPSKIQHWRVDDALMLTPVDAISTEAKPIVVKEQFLDTLILRNADEFLGHLIGQPVAFLFHSHDYWGEFDLGYVGRDGTAIVIENKAGRPTSAGRRKFRKDVSTLQENISSYVEHRFNHVIRHLDKYRLLAKRAFAASFLGVRCDVVKNSRDLWNEAAAHLDITSETLESRFRQGNQWLEELESSDSLESYLKRQSFDSISNRSRPLLLGSNVTAADLAKWNSESANDVKTTAFAGNVRLFSGETGRVEYVAAQVIGEFGV